MCKVPARSRGKSFGKERIQIKVMFRTIQGGVSVQAKQDPETGEEVEERIPYRPYFWLVCDNRSCGVAARMELPEFAPDKDINKEVGKVLQQFTKVAGEEGWMIAIDGQFCPSHARAMVEVGKARAQYEAGVAMAAKAQAPAQDPPQAPPPARASSLVQIDATPADIANAKLMAEKKRKVEAGLRNGFTDANRRAN